jgi:hypothetical protein
LASDAFSCYERIVHSVALRARGAPVEKELIQGVVQETAIAPRIRLPLGVYQALAGNDDVQFEAQLAKLLAFADLQRHLALQSLKHYLLTAHKRVLAATCLSEEQCKDSTTSRISTKHPKKSGPRPQPISTTGNLDAAQLTNHIENMIHFC